MFALISSPEPYSIPMVRRPASVVRRPSSVVRRPSSVHIFKLLLLWNRLTNQSQISCGASLGRGNESLHKWSRSHDQDGRHAQKCSKPLKIFFSGTGGPISTKLGIMHRGLQPIIVYINDDPGLTLTYFTARSNLVTKAFLLEKVKLLIFQNICSLWPESNWKNEHMWVLKVKVISWPWPKVIYIQNLKLAFLRNHWANQS